MASTDASGSAHAGIRMHQRQLRHVGALVAAFAIWELAAWQAQSRLMPGLSAVVGRLVEDASSGLLWRHAQVTLLRGFIGFGLALFIGVLLGVAMARSRVLEAMFEPLLAATYPIPKLALYPIFILFLGLGAASKVTLVALECVYPIAYNTYAGVRAVPRIHVWTARNAGASRLTVVRSVLLKSSLPSILTGVRVALPIMLVVIVVTEMLGESLGLGFLIRFAGTQFEPDGALAVVLLLGLMGLVLDRVTVFLTRWLAFWERGTAL